MLQKEITKENINKMVIKFYSTILQDNLVGPFFIDKLGDNLNASLWKTHIELLTNFWASIALGDLVYRGNPFAPHLQLHGLRVDIFERWLKLFFKTLDNLYEPQSADIFKERSTIIAKNFMRNLGLR